jgi:hypothetical protein
MSHRPAVIYGTALALSLLTFLVSYFPFVWLLQHIQTWRLGHPNPIDIGPAMDGILFSFLAAVIAFWLVVKWAKRNGLLR